MEFYLVTDGVQAALERAKKAAGSLDVRIGGGVSTLRQFLEAGLVDEMHLALRPVLMGTGEHLWHGLDLHALGYECTRTVAGERANAPVFQEDMNSLQIMEGARSHTAKTFPLPAQFSAHAESSLSARRTCILSMCSPRHFFHGVLTR